MGAIMQPPAWPEDPEHREAIETVLTMAEAEDRWGDDRRAVRLLGHVEAIVGALPEHHQRLRARCTDRLGYLPTL